MKTFLLWLCIIIAVGYATAQTVNTTQQVTLQGLRTVNGQGSFRAAKYATDGSLFLLYDQGDGLRILKTNSSGSTILTQIWTGSFGDSGIAMTIDPIGNVYVIGTSLSSALSGTSGAVFPSRADTSTNSFLAKYDSNLNLVFLTFLGSGHTSANSVSATADAIFVTGTTFNAAFPVTSAGIQQTPALSAGENGFVERFTIDGSKLAYATYLSGANGNTVPAAIIADASDNAYIAGSTSATGYPTLEALQPALLGTNSGFLSKITPEGDGFVYSTFIAGTGITSMDLDATNNFLLLTGNVSLGQFPIATVLMPLTSASYQTLLRIPFDGQSVASSVLLVPGSQSYVSAGPNGDAWVAGSLSTPLLPGAVPPNYSAGDSFLVHLTSSNTFDQTLRFGGTPVNNLGYASLTSTIAAPALMGASITLPGTIQASVAASLLTTQRYDLPLAQAPNTESLPSTLHDALPAPANCTSQCNGSAAFLSTVSIKTSEPSLSFSVDDMPNLTLRNLGSSAANNLAITTRGFSFVSDCGLMLAPSSQCSVAATGPGPGSVTVTSSNAVTAMVTLGTTTLQPNPLALSTSELDFGITTSTSPTTQTLIVSNLSSSAQTFTSMLESGPIVSATFAESASDCGSGTSPTLHVLAANSSCHLTFSLTASSSATNDGSVRASWRIGARDVVLSGYAQASALNISASELDFGTHFAINGALSGINLPRYLYVSNNSTIPIQHGSIEFASSAAFSLSDRCPSMLQPHSICQIEVTYSPLNSPSQDAASLSFDGASVLLTGKTLPPISVTGSSTNPSLSVSPTAINFNTPVIVTEVSNATQTVSVKNAGASPFALSIAISGDFQFASGCPAQLPGGASCTLLVSFSPSQPGTRLGLLSLVAGMGFAPSYIPLKGVSLPMLPANNGALDLGETLSGEPSVVWYKIQQSIASLTVSSNNSSFGVALIQDTGDGHGLLPISDFSSTATSSCGNCWLGVQFLSQTTGLQGGTLSFSTSIGGNAYALTVTGTALPMTGLLLTPTAQDFGTIDVDSVSAAVTFTLANLVSNSAAATIQSVMTSGDFSISPNQTGGPSCTGTVAGSASCFIQLVFSPTATGMRTGSLSIATSQGTVVSMLTGYGAVDPGIAISPNELNFENTPNSQINQQSVVLMNTGTAVLTIGAITSSDSSFSPVSSCTKLTSGSDCSITVDFSPQAATVTAMLSIPVTMTINGQIITQIYTVSLDGEYTSADIGLQILPSEVNFGASATGATGGTRQFTVNNLSGKQLNVTLHMPRQFALTDASACTTLAPGANCTFSVSFLPVINGAITGTVYVQAVSTDGLTSAEALTYMLGYGMGAGTLEVNGFPIPFSPLNFGQVSSGQSASQTLTLSNGASTPLGIRRISSDPPFFSTNTCESFLSGGASCTLTITYAPVYELGNGASSTAPRSDSDALTIESDAASSPDVVSMTGAAIPAVSSSPSNPITLAVYDLSQSALTFSTTQIGMPTASQVVLLTNTGTATLHVNSVVAPVDFSATTDCATLLATASCQIAVRFVPSDTSIDSIRSGSLQILSDASTSLEFVSLVGFTSAAPLNTNPSMLNFGSVNIGSTASLSLVVTNTTSAPVTLIGYSASGDYSVSQGTCPANGSALSNGSSCSLNVSFTPTATGGRSGAVTLTSSATTLPLTVTVTGVGVQMVTPTPSFALTVNGGITATMTVLSGSPAVYNLLLAPINGFLGPVALTCTPIVAATYASCSLLSSTLTLSGLSGSALSSTATINTITTSAIRSVVAGAALMLGVSLLFWRRRQRWIVALGVSLTMGFVLLGCGSTLRTPAGSNILKTPPGTYQYQVTASSTTGTVVSSTVTLNLIVQ